MEKESSMEEDSKEACLDGVLLLVIIGFLVAFVVGLVVFLVHRMPLSALSPPPKLRIYDFTVSPNFAAAVNGNGTSGSPPLTANCTIALAFDNDNRYSGIEQYDEMEVLVVWAGRNQTFMRAHPGTFSQGSLEQKPMLLAATDSVMPPDLKSAVVYTFTIDLKSRVKEDPGTRSEEAFYIKATCDDVRVGFGSTDGVDRVARMLDGPRICRVVQSKSSFNL
ncbi:unnamed protein product [Cuscuta epithymum]|uniref:Late embryogenesis abundant protein LEA-2 subgroup domain-containing protein n=1 Tax=Cuscuta epithymum TaxID=186058 RepID=A0AAV0DF82_9ASTE|nr:unnamed protein product [Cuscuta epithymum]CAH9139313.1 unnamed protein product [Cuscuta epithymum]